MNREAILTAFTNLAQTIAPFRSVSRQALLPDEITEQPALFIIFDLGNYPPRIARGAPAKVTMTVDIWIYDTPTETPETFGSTMNGYMDALDAAFGPDVMGSPQTLGGLVSDCRIEGETVFDPGHTTGQAVAKIPFKILVP